MIYRVLTKDGAISIIRGVSRWRTDGEVLEFYEEGTEMPIRTFFALDVLMVNEVEPGAK